MTKRFFCTLLLLLVSASTYGGTWEEGDGNAFETGNLVAVKRILSQTAYSGEQLIQAFETSVQSGSMDLVKFLDKKGWLEICRKDKRCDPVLYAVISRKHPAMVTYLLSRGFQPSSEALYHAAAQVTPDDETISDSLIAVKTLCDAGTNLTTVSSLEQRLTQNVMDLGSPLNSARGKSAEAIVVSFLKSGACKKGAMLSREFDDYLAMVLSFRRGNVSASASTSLTNSTLRPEVETYLFYEAVASGKLEFLEQLNRQGWISGCRSRLGCRPMDVAAEVGSNERTLQFLATAGFDIDSLNASGGTPMMYAALNANVNGVKFLCERGADFRKHVKLEVYERSITSIVRRSYSSAWCTAVASGANPKNIRDRVFCEEEGGPQSEITVPECVPGNSCRSIPFPPKGQDGAVRQLRALADIFQYFKNGQCKPAQSTSVCTAHVAPKAAIIAENVNLRAQPSSTGAKLDSLAFGSVAEVIDSTRACESLAERVGRWIKIKVLSHSQPSDSERPKAEGWIFDAYVDYFPSFQP